VSHHDAVCGEGGGGGTPRRRGGRACTPGNVRYGGAEESAAAGRRGEDGRVRGRRVVEELHGGATGHGLAAGGMWTESVSREVGGLQQLVSVMGPSLHPTFVLVPSILGKVVCSLVCVCLRSQVPWPLELFE
jgi:hypothetical protein